MMRISFFPEGTRGITGCLLIAAWMCSGLSLNAWAVESPGDHAFRGQAQRLKVASEELDEEIKSRLRGVEGWRKLASTNDRIRRRAAALDRRAQRNRGADPSGRELDKIQGLAVELDSLNSELLARAGAGHPIPAGDLRHVTDRVSETVGIVDRMRDNFGRQVSKVPRSASERQTGQGKTMIPTLNAPVDHWSEPAPGYEPFDERGTQEPVLQAPIPTPYATEDAGRPEPSASPRVFVGEKASSQNQDSREEPEVQVQHSILER